MNHRLTIQYDGTEFHGWQMQPGRRTVQGELARALGLLEDCEVVVHGAGRTDAGVHAVAQSASVHLERELTGEALCAAVNGNLPRDVRVIRAEVMPDDFHARFDARGKTYLYRIFNESFISPFWSRYAHQEARGVNLEKMKSCVRLFVGEHDWTAFSAAAADVRSRVRRLTALEVEESWSERGQGRLINISVSADGFLRYMVRTIAGTLLAVGRGELDERDVSRMIETGERPHAAVTARACGLTLMRVHYD